ncbi:Acg family FMN-binding oxidoreductase [Mycolicibacterium monacense]|uniref:NAD(P)H nitroreductase n=1 Tax=Mycolicibacterium monacense TaxID=85693 RepID=A0AAD1MUZ2_MYCMB|nr:NAD(P)H nitroreductase [Mycolicibacterium monacense]MDA4101184.1 NAD(P)H nitroreductase [Mycolicibacterium monacense DSM 44395]ORB18965.1 NAD(P)H nitroreductase [Mycolicibacterium monacense DSM 44395]QHP87864.1 NAD(P)H nitroreductase [Mycolicibacterium monacense DSM 44395]BBZ58943.1 putative NAD(P)H nitroreductase [Mycolicibacterium monacense]
MTSFPDADTLRAALASAVRAPSVHNSQPWRWHVGADRLDLFAVPRLHLRHIDPDGRDFLLSCGATLHHAVVALAALGWQARVQRFPDPSDTNHLAVLTLSPQAPTSQELALAAAIPRRRTDRRRYSSREVSPADIAVMGARAARFGVSLRRVESLTGLRAAVDLAVREHLHDDAYLRELTAWTGRHGSVAGVPATNIPPADTAAAVPPRVFAGTAMAQPSGSADDADNAAVLALGTRDDDAPARLRAGEATSVVLLTATSIGLASCPVTEPLEIAATRATLREEIFEVQAHPQMLLRVGWLPRDAVALPATPRRPLPD